MKNLLFFALIILFYSCCSHSETIADKDKPHCRECVDVKLPVFNGDSSTKSKSTANIAVDSSTKVIETATTFELQSKINCRHNGGNNSAWDAKAIVILPAESRLLDYYCTLNGSKENCRSCLVWGNFADSDPNVTSGYLEFSVRTLERMQAGDTGGDDFRIYVKTSKSSETSEANFAVFAMSNIPDEVLCDNYWFWKQGAYCQPATILKK